MFLIRDWRRLIDYSRYVVFSEAIQECGSGSGSHVYCSTISFSNKDECPIDIAFRSILKILGFGPVDARFDRDEHILIHKENLPPHFQFDLKDYSYLNSSNPVFSFYDISSILHAPAYSPEA
uniref:Peptidase M12A domain-containing protein n=1 Tax=Panagrolaimus davidi TaxID=227884 RepID=A0A914QM83_9BILA